MMALLLLVLNVGNILTLLLMFFAPGYFLVAGLFPRVGEIDWIERIALSFGLSIAVVPLLGFALDFTPYGIRFQSVSAIVGLFTIFLGLTAYWRRMRLPKDQRLAATLVLKLVKSSQSSSVDKLLTFALGASVVLAAATLGYLVVFP